MICRARLRTSGLMGILSLFGLDLDPITMSVVIIAIGFSVDFTAHICYHFYHYNDSADVSNDCTERKIRKLSSIYLVIGEPTIQVNFNLLYHIIQSNN